jgi:hypothetical protein
MPGVYVMKMSLDHVVRVIAVWHGRVSAAWAVMMGLIVPAALMVRRTGRRVRLTDGNRMLFHGRPILIMKMAIVHIVLMAVMCDARVAAVGAVNVWMGGLRVVWLRVLGLRLWRHVPSGW